MTRQPEDHRNPPSRSDGTLSPPSSQPVDRHATGDARILSPVGSWEWDFTANTMEWDETAHRMFGFEAEAPRNLEYWLNHVHPDDRVRVQSQLLDLQSQEWNAEFRFLRPDGKIMWIHGLGGTSRDPTGQSQRRAGFFLDITPRKIAEEQQREWNTLLEQQINERTADLIQREYSLRAILDTAFSGIITINSQGIMQSVNKSAEQMFGYDASEMIGNNVNMLMPSPYREEHDSYIRRYLESGQTGFFGKTRELQGLRKDGSRVDLAIAVSRVDHLELFTGLLLDITRRKQLEREVVEIASLEQQRIGQDLHDDCGQELTALGLLASTLVEDLQNTGHSGTAMAMRVENGIRRVLNRIREIAQGLIRSEWRASDLPEALGELATRLTESTGIKCVFHNEESLFEGSNIQAIHLFHIAQEAINNAVKHARATVIDVYLHVNEDEIMIQIRDDGSGMPAEVPEGLGLRIMRNRALILGGKLNIENANPHGTVVTCTIIREH